MPHMAAGYHDGSPEMFVYIGSMVAAERRNTRVLILATTTMAGVLGWCRRILHREPDAEIILGIPETEERTYEGSGFATIGVGVDHLDLDRPSVRQRIEDEKPDMVLIPLGFPLTPLMVAARWATAGPGTLAGVGIGPTLITGRHPVRLALILYSVLIYGPMHLLYRLSSLLDGLLVVLALRGSSKTTPPPETSAGGRSVCHVITNLKMGGAQKQLIEYLLRTDHAPRSLVVLGQAPGAVVARLRQRGIAVTVLTETTAPTTREAFHRRLLPHYRTLQLLRRHLREERPCVLVNWLFFAIVVGAAAGGLEGVTNMVHCVRNLSAWKTWPEYRQWWFRIAERQAARRASVVTGNARAVVDDYVQWTGVPEDRCSVVYNGIDLESFDGIPDRTSARDRLGWSRETPVLLTVGRLAPEKSHWLCVEWLHRLLDRGVAADLVIVGEGPEFRAIEIKAKELGVEDRVRIVRGVRDARLFYRAADVFVLSSRIEGLPNVLMEAQLSGLPAVTTPCGGAHEVLVDGETGAVVPFDRPDQAADTIATLIRDPGLHRRLSDNARRHIRERFGLERFVARLDGIVNQVHPH